MIDTKADCVGKKLSFWLIIVSALVFLIPLLILSFYNHASADDYIAGYRINHLGFTGFQKDIYLHWGGRYFSTFIAAVFANYSFLFWHYYLHTILLVVLTIASVGFLLQTFNVYWLTNILSLKDIVLVSVVFTITLFSCYPELSTALFWFSSAVTYQSSVILILTAFALAVRVLKSVEERTVMLSFVLLNITIILINGTNEVAALTTGLLLLILAGTLKQRPQRKSTVAFVVLIVYLGTLMLLCFAPGNKERFSFMDGSNILAGTASCVLRIFVAFWNVLQSPLFWINSLAVFLFAVKNTYNIAILKRNKASLKTALLLVSILVFCLIMILLPILYLSNGSFPDRALNVVVFVVLVSLLLMAFYLGLCVRNKSLIEFSARPKVIVVVMLFVSAGIICNQASKNVFQSLVSAKLYHTVISEREALLQKASVSVDKKALISSYEVAVPVVYNKLYGNHQKEILKQLVLQKPMLLFMFDDVADTSAIKNLKNYYGLRDVEVIQSSSIH